MTQMKDAGASQVKHRCDFTGAPHGQNRAEPLSRGPMLRPSPKNTPALTQSRSQPWTHSPRQREGTEEGVNTQRAVPFPVNDGTVPPTPEDVDTPVTSNPLPNQTWDKLSIVSHRTIVLPWLPRSPIPREGSHRPLSTASLLTQTWDKLSLAWCGLKCSEDSQDLSSRMGRGTGQARTDILKLIEADPVGTWDAEAAAVVEGVDAPLIAFSFPPLTHPTRYFDTVSNGRGDADPAGTRETETAGAPTEDEEGTAARTGGAFDVSGSDRQDKQRGDGSDGEFPLTSFYNCLLFLPLRPRRVKIDNYLGPEEVDELDLGMHTMLPLDACLLVLPKSRKAAVGGVVSLSDVEIWWR
ncbi:hypothetical protein B0H14DRAFT_2557052 [Mycena olivaceomarginata]|nr:hypothetical protein B0H14DRAFT_2557052 [Mycena olivaceomarginata]